MRKPECSRCGTNRYVRRSRRTILDIALSEFFLYPFRCDSCDHRFYRFFVGIDNRRKSL
jgi:hypothetical protein